MKTERKDFGQLVFLSIGHNVVDLELMLPFSLGPVPWSLSTPEGIPTKTDLSKLLLLLETHFEPTIDLPCSAAHDSFGAFSASKGYPFKNSHISELNSCYCHLRGSGRISIQPVNKGRACWFCH